MEQRNLMEAHVQVKRIYNLLCEVMDLSKQMAEALDRSDDVSVRMLITMRQEPINQMEEIGLNLRKQCEHLDHYEDRRRLAELLDGGQAAEPEEIPLAEQVATNARLLKQVLELDRVLSYKLARDESIYKRM